MKKEKRVKQKFGAELMFATLFLMLGISYLIRGGLMGGQEHLFQLYNLPFALATIIGVIGFIDGAIFKEKYLQSFVCLLKHDAHEKRLISSKSPEK
jgi:choline-glycine betaine transporter